MTTNNMTETVSAIQEMIEKAEKYDGLLVKIEELEARVRELETINLELNQKQVNQELEINSADLDDYKELIEEYGDIDDIREKLEALDDLECDYGDIDDIKSSLEDWNSFTDDYDIDDAREKLEQFEDIDFEEIEKYRAFTQEHDIDEYDELLADHENLVALVSNFVRNANDYV